MFGAILKATNSSFQKGMTFCRSIYVKKVMKLLAFIFEQPSYYLSLIHDTISLRCMSISDTLPYQLVICVDRWYFISSIVDVFQ